MNPGNTVIKISEKKDGTVLCTPCGIVLFSFLGGEKMIDIKLIRENKELVKENIKKKFQDL